MANFKITVKQDVPQSQLPIELYGSRIDNSCLSEKHILVYVPSGQTRFIEVRTIGTLGSTPYTNTINTDTTIILRVTGSRHLQQSLNTDVTIVSLDVRLNSQSDIYYSSSLTRKHAGVDC